MSFCQWFVARISEESFRMFQFIFLSPESGHVICSSFLQFFYDLKHRFHLHVMFHLSLTNCFFSFSSSLPIFVNIITSHQVSRYLYIINCIVTFSFKSKLPIEPCQLPLLYVWLHPLLVVSWVGHTELWAAFLACQLLFFTGSLYLFIICHRVILTQLSLLLAFLLTQGSSSMYHLYFRGSFLQ